MMPNRLRRIIPDEMIESVTPRDMFVIPDIEATCVRYVCPCCWTKYTNSGRPYKRAKHRVHEHGYIASDESNVVLIARKSHCDQGKGADHVYMFVEH